ncbi:hypothetical protein E2C01_016558 [Portunus trituberculatus]|uniref:Uncharacterized protein n=1 Tax=Portunus trituberculatus TaxID=210409 RepID=A0A5B7DQV1_PORTR|nr:hypothetical protein [Portunus trituberculatus]
MDYYYYSPSHLHYSFLPPITNTLCISGGQQQETLRIEGNVDELTLRRTGIGGAGSGFGNDYSSALVVDSGFVSLSGSGNTGECRQTLVDYPRGKTGRRCSCGPIFTYVNHFKNRHKKKGSQTGDSTSPAFTNTSSLPSTSSSSIFSYTQSPENTKKHANPE